MDCIEALRTRRSVRVYEDKPIPKDALEDIVDCGRLAPTAINIQPWEFVVVTEKDTLQKLADLTDHGKFIAQAAACVAVFCQEGKYYLEDGCAATTNVLNAAHALGLGGCWVAGDKKPYCEGVSQLLGLPENKRLISLLALGYPAEQPTTEKRALREVLHWEKFGH